MKFLSIPTICIGATLALLSISESAASLIQSSGLGTTHVGNLVINGSFELGAPPNGTQVYWADSSLIPYAVPPAWNSSGPGSLAVWGNDGPSPYRLKLSDVLPDGRAAVDFRTATNVAVSQQPTFNPNGSVTFPGTPTFTSTAGAPVILTQTVNTQLVPSPSYNLSFWVSGEENSTNQGFTGAGLIGLQLTNVLAGDPIQWLAVPNAFFYGQSILYEFSFTPINSSLPVDISFINWGGLDLSPYGMSAFGTQPILDDVIVNAVPEMSSFLMLAVAAGGLFVVRRWVGKRT